MSKRFQVSIVIPAYNESDTLRRCLDAIAAQTVPPDEVLVVDNNSIDDTVAVARSYTFVTVLREERQGVVHARNRGFDAATGDIIGRIDADTVIAPDWIATLRRIFIATKTDATTGSVQYHDVVFPETWAAVDMAIRRYLAIALGPEVAIQGANMAIRKTAWEAIRRNVCMSGGLHEDFDIGLHLYRQGYSVKFHDTLRASIQLRQAGNSWRDFTAYVMMSPRTYAMHQRISRIYMYPVVLLAVAFYPILFVAYRGYDAESGRFSIRQLFGARSNRVNPALYVD